MEGSEARLQIQDLEAYDLQEPDHLPAIGIQRYHLPRLEQSHHQEQGPGRLEGHGKVPKEGHREGSCAQCLYSPNL